MTLIRGKWVEHPVFVPLATQHDKSHPRKTLAEAETALLGTAARLRLPVQVPTNLNSYT